MSLRAATEQQHALLASGNAHQAAEDMYAETSPRCV